MFTVKYGFRFKSFINIGHSYIATLNLNKNYMILLNISQTNYHYSIGGFAIGARFDLDQSSSTIT